MDLHSLPDRKLLIQFIRRQKPIDVWSSPPCTTWTAVQNINIARYGRRPFCEKAAFELLSYLKRLHKIQRQLGGRSHHEQSNRSRAPCDTGEWPSVIENVDSVSVSGCAVGLKNPSGELLAKAWRIESTSKELLQALAPFKCSGGHAHGVSLGNNILDKTACYFATFP